jgi:hypothetical protein
MSGVTPVLSQFAFVIGDTERPTGMNAVKDDVRR